MFYFYFTIFCTLLKFSILIESPDGSTYESTTALATLTSSISQTTISVNQQANHCLSTLCINGNCTSLASGYKCICKPKFRGTNCEYNDHCYDHKCENGATCVEIFRSASYICKCLPGFSGKFCEHRTGAINKCDGNYCQNNSTCQMLTNSIDSIKCICLPGFTGNRCDTKIDYCEPNPCENNAICLSNALSYSCNCSGTGFKGINCTENIDECLQYPCYNNGTCIDYKGGYNCHCRTEFRGKKCELNSENCSVMKCKNNGECVDTKDGSMCLCTDQFTGHVCEIDVAACNTEECYKDVTCYNGYCTNKDPCLKSPCLNGATCLPSVNYVTGVSCFCPPGFTGEFCQFDGCRMRGIPCEHGRCLPDNHTFSCFCERGYSGERCERNFNECLSSPCKNNATCFDGIDQFICECTPGFAGIDCSIDINECNSNPCQGNSVCIDLINAFKCNCEIGLTGNFCEINIDDCSPNPCENNGTCIDGLSTYTCDCTNTGFTGFNCEINIDDCASNPCQNGATCIDQINDYACKCYSGYLGRQCEIDRDECASVPCKFGSTCLQKSNMSLYQTYTEDVMLPEIFQNEFSFENASGYECICVNGTTGDNCEIDIDECETVHCIGGKCEDKLGYYICNCDEGYEGDKCEIEINECQRYKPCLNNAKCHDRVANYYCECMPGYGGKNCSISLIGCLHSKCLNNGTCKPDLINETIHTFNCSCPSGFHGQTCEKLTTMSFSGQSFVQVNTSKEEGYEIQFKFRTTVDNSLLAFGQGQTYYVLKLSGGKLNLQSSLLNKWDGVFIGGGLNNSHWQRIFVAINASHLVLAANDEQTIYPISLHENMNTSHTSFSTTYLGGTINELRTFAKSPSFFIGCLENTIVNGQWVLPPQENHGQNDSSSLQIFNDVEIRCPRKVQCDPNPCKSGGTCIDNWRNFSCLCQRPYLGDTCQYNYTAATFGYENITNSYVTVQVYELSKKITKSCLNISMFIRTRQSTGKIFYLGSALNRSRPEEPSSYIATMLDGGRLVVKIRFKSAPTPFFVSSAQLDNGYYHFIEVIRVIHPQVQVRVKLNGTEYFRNLADDNLNIQMLYLGDWPDFESMYRKADEKISESNELQTLSPITNSFKGIIQDVQISNENQTMVVEFFPLGLNEIPMSFGNISLDPKRVLKGVLSDDVCKTNICQNNGNCSVTWNDFICSCNIGFKGRFCEQIEYCQLDKCPENFTCNSVNKYYECLSNVTFNGVSDPPIMYRFMNRILDNYTFNTIRLSARTQTEGYVLTVRYMSNYFALKINNLGEILIETNFDGAVRIDKLIDETIEQGNWFNLLVHLDENEKDLLKIKFDSNEMKESSVIKVALKSIDFNEIIQKGEIILGGRMNFDYIDNISNKTDNKNETEYDYFKGCLGIVKFDNISLWYKIPDDLTYFDYYFELQNNIENNRIGCTLCHDNQCKNNGHCLDAEQSYNCSCTKGYSGIDCSTNEDNCINHLCVNNATCEDGLDEYTCKCQNNTQGNYCEVINNCLSMPCHNGGTCETVLNGYVCKCSIGYNGTNCEEFSNDCSQNPCLRNNCTNCDSSCDLPCDKDVDCDKIIDECNCSNNSLCSKPALNSSNEFNWNLRYILIPLLIILFFIVFSSLGFFITVARTKRATRGTYSPSAQEYSNPRVELGHVLKHPPEERLI